MLSSQQIQDFDRDGYLNIGDVLNEEELQELAQELDRILGKGPDGFAEGEPRPVLFRNLAGGGEYRTKKPVWQIVNIWEASKSFERLMYHPVIVKAINQLTGFGDLQVWHDQVQYKPPRHGGATGWHQDAPLWPSIEPMTPVSAWLPFDDADESNGCMWMVPGSHKWGCQIEYLMTQVYLQKLPEFTRLEGFTPPDEAKLREVIPVPRPVRRGEIHFHHSLTWHGSPQNLSERPRRAIAIHYMTSEARYTGRAHPMQPFIEVQTGEPMLKAGRHFPVVCRGGEPICPPTAIK